MADYKSGSPNSMEEKNEDFHNVCIMVRENKLKMLNLSNEQQMEIYGLYKQAEWGPNPVDNRPPVFKGATVCQKWDTWTSKKELTQEQAVDAYLAYVEELQKGGVFK